MQSTIRSPDLLFIGGSWVKPSTSAKFDVIHPSTEDVFLQVSEAKEEDMQRAIEAARVAFDEGPWPRMRPAERATYLEALADAMRKRSEDLCSMWTGEMGVLHSFARAGAPSMGHSYDYYAWLASTFPFVERHVPSAGAKVALLACEPVGVVGVIVPWNAPITLTAIKVAPALLAGCTVIVKASPEAPTSILALGEMAEEIGFPPGVVNCLTADRDVSELLVSDSRVDKIAFTGSTAAGRKIAALCGQRIARYTLELGGKSAGVILDDYDLSAAVASLTTSAVRMTGQACASLTRIIVNRKRHDDFVEALSESFSKVQVGDPYDPASEMGPLAMRRQRDRVEGFIATGRREGATLACGGSRPTHLDRGFYIEPTVFANVDNTSTIAREEIFGPVLSVIPADDERHAIKMANDTIFGLNNVVFTNDADRAFEVARQLRSGTVGHNAAIYDFDVAFGGFKQSGIGREGGREGLLPYLEAKTILLNGEPSWLSDDLDTWGDSRSAGG